MSKAEAKKLKMAGAKLAADKLVSKYQKLDHREHVLKRPNMYIGSIDKDICSTWVFDDTKAKMTKKELSYVPGLYKIFDEILVNAIDHVVRLKSYKEDKTVNLVKNIKITIDKESGYIEVYNDGDGIEVEKHPEHGIYIPELIFGHLLTSANYDDTEEKTIGGQNGLGSKCVSFDTQVPLFNGEVKLAKNIQVGDILIGDDGNPRNVLSTQLGHGKMYEVSQIFGDNYKVNDEHILTLHMPDHKVIFWDTNGWKLVWWDKKKQGIKTKFTRAIQYEKTPCEECGQELSSSIKRHYKRVHPDMQFPVRQRKSPTKVVDMSNEDVKNAYVELSEFAKTIDDDNVIDISIKAYLNLPKTTQSRLAGLRGDCVNWDYNHVNLDPYVLGLWLGDGVKHGYSYACDGANDPELIDYLKQWGENNDSNLKHHGRYTYGFSSIDNFRKKGYAPLRKVLKEYNLINNKHIPKEYLINSREVRLSVLAGLIDTDGTVCRDGTRIVITQGLVHKELAEDILYLCRSLGFCCSKLLYTAEYSWNGEKKNSKAYKINISGNVDDIPTRLPRKICRTTKSKNTDKTTGQIRITEIPDNDYIGITIDENERFVINDFTVTHNCTNVFAKHFTVETVDAKKKKLYTQEFFDNMSRKSDPVIKSCSKKPYTIIKFLPDYEKFKCTGMSNDMYDLMVKRTYDTCAVTDNDVNVYLNGKKLEFKTFEKYVDLYLGSKSDHMRVYEKIDERWEVVASFNEESRFEQVSFVNGIWTIRGGKHVDYISNQLIKKVIDMAQKKKKDITIKPQYLKDNLIIFIKAIIVNPNFDSQTKETLTTPFSKFGSKPELSEKFIEKIYKSGIVEKALSIGSLLDNKNMKKTDGKKRNVIRGLAKLDDANWAGTSKSSQCTLILTEGDSAKTMAMAGIDEVGRDKYGVFPLKGKLLNVKDCKVQKIIDNEEISNLKKIIGLESDKIYNTVDDLRYGHIMIMSDQDVDGSHIKGLLFNLFHTLWPSLYQHDGFLSSMLTPIVKVRRDKKMIEFYNLTDYNNWKEVSNNGEGWHIKYYKGLGTSNGDEAREYFKTLKLLKYKYDGESSDTSLDLAFNKKRADDRKAWLSGYDKENVLDYNEPEVKFDDFIGKELIHFSNYDVQRSIPSLCDGLKISQRKILHCCLKRDWSKECKVAQLSAYVSEHSAYHHGEESLNNCIVSMAQNFVGSNNINLLRPNGQFGSRIKGGKDSASPRYIYTEINPITRKIYKKEDSYILNFLDDDGMSIEPEYFIPIIPMVLVNGALGIGTGFSTSIPCYNPKDIILCLKQMLSGEDPECKLLPWFAGFNGTIKETGGKLFSKGVYEKIGATKIRINELPIGFWTEDFKEHLEHLLDDPKTTYFKSYESHYNDIKVDFILHFQNSAALDKLLEIEDNGFTKFENEFKLCNSKTLGTTNMYLFNSKNQIQKFANVKDIITEFYNIRLTYYHKRKEYQQKKLAEDRKYLKARIDFINEVIAGTLVIYNETKKIIEERLKNKNYPLKDNSYDYLVGMPIYNLTAEKKFKLDSELTGLDETINDINVKTCQQMWCQDLDDLDKTYDSFMKEFVEGLSKKTVKNKK